MGKKPAVAKPKNGQPPPVDKLIKPAIGIAMALVAYQFFKGIGAEIPRVNVLDELEIRDVFFGEGGTGNSYVVLCNDEKSSLPISSVFQDALKAGSTTASFRLIDCNHVLPESGKTIAERFNLDLKIRPTIFISGAAVDAPAQIPEKHLKSGKILAKVLRAKLEPHAAKIETTQDLKMKCLDKDICGLLLKGSKKSPQYLKDAMQNLLKEFPKISFAAIDSTVQYVKNLEDQLPELSDGQPRFVVFRKVSGSASDKEKGRLITSIAPLSTNGVSYGQMSNLVAGVVQNTQTMERLPMLPSVKLRTKKLEQEEKKKRERKASRARGDDEGNGGPVEANDGSAEGRRLERERRRAEHRKKNMVREKTPEEIAEIERQRRIRMEEEAERWNMAPEDMPDTGEPLDDEGDLDDEEEYLDEDEESEDDEDVIDLD